jgi:hypothetical protein
MSSVINPSKSWNAKSESDNKGIGFLVLVAIVLLIWLGPKFCSNTNNPSNTKESQINMLHGSLYS